MTNRRLLTVRHCRGLVIENYDTFDYVCMNWFSVLVINRFHNVNQGSVELFFGCACCTCWSSSCLICVCFCFVLYHATLVFSCIFSLFCPRRASSNHCCTCLLVSDASADVWQWSVICLIICSPYEWIEWSVGLDSWKWNGTLSILESES